jgi:hypothetical protein
MPKYEYIIDAYARDIIEGDRLVYGSGENFIGHAGPPTSEVRIVEGFGGFAKVERKTVNGGFRTYDANEPVFILRPTDVCEAYAWSPMTVTVSTDHGQHQIHATGA